MLACGFVRTADRKALECLSAPPTNANRAGGWGLSVFALKVLCQQRVELQRILASYRMKADGMWTLT